MPLENFIFIVMKAETFKKGQDALKRFDRFKLGSKELHSIKGGSYQLYYIDGKWYYVWVDD